MSESNTHPNRDLSKETLEARRTAALNIAAQVNAGTGKSPEEIGVYARAIIGQIAGGFPQRG